MRSLPEPRRPRHSRGFAFIAAAAALGAACTATALAQQERTPPRTPPAGDRTPDRAPAAGERTPPANAPAPRLAADPRGIAESMRQNDITLAEAIKTAESHANGRAIDARCRFTEGGARQLMVDVVCIAQDGRAVQLVTVGGDGEVASTRALRDTGAPGAPGTAGTRIVKASDIVGEDVRNAANEDIGEIEDLAIDPARGRIAYAVLSFGGTLGMNEKLVAVPWSAVQQVGDTVRIDIPKERLQNAPGFDPGRWPDMADVEFGRQISSFYGQPSYGDGDQPLPAGQRLRILKASDFDDRDVVNAQGENLGEIEDLAIDPATGRIAYAVLSFGGFLGFNDKLFAVPWDALQHRADTCVLAVDKERLRNAPGFDEDRWPNMADPSFDASLREFYRSRDAAAPPRP